MFEYIHFHKEFCSGCFLSSRYEKSKSDSYEAQNYKNNNFKHTNYLWKKNYCTVLFWGVIFFIILWNKEMTITNRQYGSNKHECILVVKQRQFGLNFLFFTLIIISNLFSQSYVCTGLSVWLRSFVTILYSLLFQIIVCHTMSLFFLKRMVGSINIKHTIWITNNTHISSSTSYNLKARKIRLTWFVLNLYSATLPFFKLWCILFISNTFTI